MDFERRIKAIELIISEIPNMSPIERLNAYATTKTILDDMEEYISEHESENLDHGMSGEYIASIYGPLEALAGLEDSGCHDEARKIELIDAELFRLRSVHCFNIQ